jgi:competence protein ComGF
MILDIIISTADKVLNVSIKWLDQNLASNFMSFIKGFEFAIIIMMALFFLLVSVHIMMRQYKRLPKSYQIVVYDVYGRETVIDGIRQTFATHDAAESYARFYSEMYERQQYKFKVTGNFSKCPSL